MRHVRNKKLLKPKTKPLVKELKFATMTLHAGDFVELTTKSGKVVKGIVCIDPQSPTSWSLKRNNHKTYIMDMVYYKYAKKDIHHGHNEIHIH